MSTAHLLDPELARLPELIPGFSFTAESLPDFREAQNQAITLNDPDAAGVIRSEVMVPRRDGGEVRALLYQPKTKARNQPGYLHIHGGGYIIGSPEGSDLMNLQIASTVGTVVLSVDYRLAPEHPVPAPLDDCYAGLAWLHGQAGELDIDPQRIAVGGESAGGGLAAALAIHARDLGEYPVCHQHLTYPMLDDRTGTADHPGDPLVGEFVWTRENNQFGWQSLLGGQPPGTPWVPARLENFSGLPSTWMFTAALDLFRDENISYAQSLMRAGVRTELELFSGACHGFQMLPGTRLGARYTQRHLEALGRGLA